MPPGLSAGVLQINNTFVSSPKSPCFAGVSRQSAMVHCRRAHSQWFEQRYSA